MPRSPTSTPAITELSCGSSRPSPSPTCRSVFASVASGERSGSSMPGAGWTRRRRKRSRTGIPSMPVMLVKRSMIPP